MINTEHAKHVKTTAPLSRLLCLELLDIIVSGHRAVFEAWPPLLDSARTIVRYC